MVSKASAAVPPWTKETVCSPLNAVGLAVPCARKMMLSIRSEAVVCESTRVLAVTMVRIIKSNAETCLHFVGNIRFSPLGTETPFSVGPGLPGPGCFTRHPSLGLCDGILREPAEVHDDHFILVPAFVLDAVLREGLPDQLIVGDQQLRLLPALPG